MPLLFDIFSTTALEGERRVLGVDRVAVRVGRDRCVVEPARLQRSPVGLRDRAVVGLLDVARRITPRGFRGAAVSDTSSS